MVCIGMVLLGLGCSKRDTPPFVKAKITIPYFPLEGIPPRTEKTITDLEEVNRLASFFTGLGEGRASYVAGGWEIHGKIDFFCSNREVVTVTFDDFGYWSESGGNGDWPLPDDFKPYFLKLMKEPEQAADNGEQNPTDPPPSDK